MTNTTDFDYYLDLVSDKSIFNEQQNNVIIEESITHSESDVNWIKVDKKGEKRVLTSLLAEHIRNTQHYYFTRDTAKDPVERYFYCEEGYYKLVSDDEVKGIIKQFIPLEIQRIRDINEVFALLITDRKFIPKSKFDDNEELICFKNGVFNLRTIEFTEHSPKYLLKTQVNCNYIKELKKPEDSAFEKYINHLCDGDQGKRSLILQFLGMALSNVKAYRPKKALFIVGQHDTGKSQIRDLATSLIGEVNNSSVDLGTLEARFGTSVVYGKRLVGSSDMSFMTVGELKALKQLTGGDSIYAEFKGENGFTFRFTGVLWFCCNDLPKFGGDKGDGVYDRMLVVECNNPVIEKDRDLQAKLFAERDYIANIAIRELFLKVIMNGYNYTVPESVASIRDVYKKKNNSFLTFVEECTQERENNKIDDRCTKKRFFDVYVAWCKDNNKGHSETAREIKRLLDEMGRGEIKAIKGSRYYADITLTIDTKLDYINVYGYEDDIKKLIDDEEKKSKSKLKETTASLPIQFQDLKSKQLNM